MKYKLRRFSLKLIIVLYVITVITSFYSNYCYVVKAADSDLSGVIFIGDSRLGDPVKPILESKGATVFKCVASNPQQWNSVTSSGSGTVTTKNESINVSFPDKSKVSAVAIQLGVNDIGSIEAYKKVVNNLKSLYPDATIYCMSIIYCNGGYEYLNSSLITYNNDLKNYCTGKVKYVDTNSGICSNNKLDMSYSGDGLHLNSSGATKFVDNIDHDGFEVGAKKLHYQVFSDLRDTK